MRVLLLFFVSTVIFGDGHGYSHLISKRQAVLEDKQFGPCKTPDGVDGQCRLITYCQMPELRNDTLRLIEHLCVIEGKSIGICCPSNYDNPSGPRFSPSEDARIVNTPKRPEQRGCGITTKQFPRITGGRPADPEEWPWMAAIVRIGFPSAYCGGALITDRHVLTAAHCLDRVPVQELLVRLGEYDFKTFNETRARDFRVASMVLHVDYDPITYQNDIAIMRVIRPTIFNTYIWPVCMPPLGENWAGSTGVVTGWGTQQFGGPHSNILMEVAVPIWPMDQCRRSFVENIADTMLCAGAKEGGRDSCQGDSGGPLLVQLPNNRWIVVGVVSWGLRCGEANQPGLYTRVDKYVRWVIDNSLV